MKQLTETMIVEARYDFPGEARIGLITVEGTQDVEVHRHDNPRLIFVLKGNFTDHLEHDERQCGVGQALFRSAGEWHRSIYLEPSTTYLGIELPRDLATKLRLPSGSTLITRANIAACASALAQELQAADPFYQLDLRSRLTHLVRRVRSNTPAWLDSVDEFVRENLGQHLGLVQIAQKAGVNPSYLSRAYAQFSGETLGMMLSRERLMFARKLICDGECSLGEIALRAGFCDQSHLGRLFRDRYGDSPGTYRQKILMKGKSDSRKESPHSV